MSLIFLEGKKDGIKINLSQIYLDNGSDEINEVWRQAVQNGLQLVSFYVVIFDAKNVNQSQKSTIKMIQDQQLHFIVCLNQADRAFAVKKIDNGIIFTFFHF